MDTNVYGIGLLNMENSPPSIRDIPIFYSARGCEVNDG